MFERFKCYHNLRKSDKYLRGVKRLGEITNNEEYIREVNEAMYLNAVLRSKMWFNRKMAKKYNMQFIRHGFK